MIDRRTFLKGCAAFGGGAVIGGAFVLRRDAYRAMERRIAMGTYVQMTVVDPSRARAEEAIGRAFDEMDRRIALLSRFDPSSPVYVLNRDGHVEAAPELVECLNRAVEIHRLTGGAFDPTILPVLECVRRNEPPDLALADVGALRIGREIRFAKSGMGLTLDGIAKGFIVDSMVEISGATNVMVAAGGDIRTRGGPWRVAVQDPEKKGAYPDVITLTDGAVSTSGSYEVCYGRDRHHLVDPKTGTCPGRASSTVLAATCAESDALATGTFILDPTAACSLMDTLDQGCLILGREGTQWRSRKWS